MGLRLSKTSRGFLTLCYIMKANGKVGAVASNRLNWSSFDFQETWEFV